jgi:hypothetical protein
MSAAIPITNGQMSTPIFAGVLGPSTRAQTSPAPTAPATGGGGGSFNTPVHVGAIVLGALALVITLHLLGFRFGATVSGNVGR